MNCNFENNEMLINKIYEKGFEYKELPIAHHIKCKCGEQILMETCITKCKVCNTTFGITPCSWEEASNIVSSKN